MAPQQVHFLSDPIPFLEKERLYLEVRRREGRVLNDEDVKMLPNASATSPYTQEWRWRKRSFLRLKRYLRHKTTQHLRILDLGCGNGWMANRLAENPDWSVIGMDLNVAELTQGARLFGRKNLQFVYADLLQNALLEAPGIASQHTIDAPGLPASGFPGAFDVIVLAASVQYFPNQESLVASLQALLNTGGEIHMIDSHFYPSKAAKAAARQRTLDYYTTAGVPEMADYYHHHLWPELQQLGAENLNKNLLISILQKTGYFAPFPWIRIRHHGQTNL